MNVNNLEVNLARAVPIRRFCHTNPNCRDGRAALSASAKTGPRHGNPRLSWFDSPDTFCRPIHPSAILPLVGKVVVRGLIGPQKIKVNQGKSRHFETFFLRDRDRPGRCAGPPAPHFRGKLCSARRQTPRAGRTRYGERLKAKVMKISNLQIKSWANWPKVGQPVSREATATPIPKRQRTGALQNLSAHLLSSVNAKRLGVRRSSAAFLHRREMSAYFRLFPHSQERSGKIRPLSAFCSLLSAFPQSKWVKVGQTDVFKLLTMNDLQTQKTQISDLSTGIG